MLTVNALVPPSADQFDLVFKGMRLPLKSGHLSDSRVAQVVGKQFMMGEKDKRLALNLIKAGASDRKFLRQLPIVMEVTADQVFWRQADQYKVGTTTNSSSQMHKLMDTHFTLDDFNIPLDGHTPDVADTVTNFIGQINSLIGTANRKKQNGDASWKDDWELALSLVPQSVLYTKCWSLNYETALNIGLQRERHKNRAWDELIGYWKDNLPYYKEFLDAAKENVALTKLEAEYNKKFEALEANFDKLLNWHLEVMDGVRMLKKERDRLIVDTDKFGREYTKLEEENNELRKKLES